MSRRESSGSGMLVGTDVKQKRREQNRVAQQRYRQKIARQVRHTEQLVLRAEQALRAQPSTFRCPECAHCHQLGDFQGSTSTNKSWFPSPSPTSAETTAELMGGDLQLTGSPQPEFCFDPNLLDGLDLKSPDFHVDHLGQAVLTDAIQDLRHSEPHTTPSNLPTPSANDGYPTRRITLSDDLGTTGSASAMAGNTSSSTNNRGRGLDLLGAALHLAAGQGKSAMISILLRSGAHVDTRDPSGRTPLRLCSENGHVQAATALVAAGADLGATDNEGTSVISAAVSSGHEELVEYLAGRLAAR